MATSATQQIFVFSTPIDPAEAWKRAETFVAMALRRGLDARRINRLASNVDDLLLVAEHRVVTSPTTVALRGGKVVLRLNGIPAFSTLLRALDMT